MSAEQAAARPRARSFRPDIQGVRALAVLLVIVEHLASRRLTGGFVGVDVFFVVSGYLITSLLLAEAGRSQRISLTGFYARRARRILPAATVVILATIVGSLVMLPLLRVQTILSDAVWATFFAANVRMAQVGTDYFAIGQPPSPLRHYWSLSVEEQFYLVWPALLVGCLLLLLRRGRTSEHDVRRTAGVLIVVVSLASLAWSVWTTYHSPVTAYYSSFARAWELGAGAACALLARRTGGSRMLREVVAVTGLAAIGVAAVAYSADTRFPGAYALLPVLGAAGLMWAGHDGGRTAVGRLLSVRPLVVVGDWSYSLYLWHWPVIVLVRSQLGPARFGTLPVLVATLAGVFLLSWASYRWIEEPFRRSSWRPSRALVIYPVSIAMVVVSTIAATQVVSYRLGEWSNEPAISTAQFAGQHLGKDPYVALVRASVLAAREGLPVPSHLVPGLLDLRSQTAPLGDCDYRTGTTELCPVGDAGADRTVVVLGDSHARALSPAVVRLGERLGYRVYVLVYSGCSANSAVQIDRDTGRRWDDCERFKDWAQAEIARLHPDLVVVSTSAGIVEDPETGTPMRPAVDPDRYLAILHDGWQRLFEDLRRDASAVALVAGTPKLPRETGVCLSKGHPDLGDCAFPPGRAAQREAAVSLEAARSAGALAVDAAPWFCADGLCPSVVGRYITMRDSEHMTPDYARWLAVPLGHDLGLSAAS